jgi:Flp pilus assembly protein TadD
MRRGSKATIRSLALSLIGLAGCQTTPNLQLDPLSTSGRDGGQTISYAAMLRIAAAARAGGDYANAVSMYRHAAGANPLDPVPRVGLGDSLLDAGQVNEAIVAYNEALAASPHDRDALLGLAKAYLRTGRPELAGNPLATVFQDNPNDPKVLLLIGVADDFVGQHLDAQKRYRAALQIAPGDAALTLDLALSLALSENFDEAIVLLRPVALAPAATPLDRQTLALIYGLKGDQREARQFAQIDLAPAAVAHNLAFYESLRRLSPDLRSRAILSASVGGRAPPS